MHTASTITVHQTYSPEIGMPAVRQDRFPAAWKRDRTTWVTKPRSQPNEIEARRVVHDQVAGVGAAAGGRVERHGCVGRRCDA
ncbi:DUF4291 family protein [Streptomyces sp. NPDC059697]|uniref:DUF4291 family protein n=1 Tax=Streptomyces sp. NPDC059697 TaxID=3346912 RepID=UPI0036C4395E